MARVRQCSIPLMLILARWKLNARGYVEVTGVAWAMGLIRKRKANRLSGYVERLIISIRTVVAW